MKKVTKYLLKRISDLEMELCSTKKRNSILEGERSSWVNRIHEQDEEILDLENQLFQKSEALSALQKQIRELTTPKKFGDLECFKDLKTDDDIF
jgi:chromosome segregation ATPase